MLVGRIFNPSVGPDVLSILTSQLLRNVQRSFVAASCQLACLWPTSWQLVATTDCAAGAHGWDGLQIRPTVLTTLLRSVGNRSIANLQPHVHAVGEEIGAA